MADQALALLSAAAVRERAHDLLALASAGELQGWRLGAGRLERVADAVAEVIRRRYPDLQVPFHSRWRHFAVAGRDLWGEAQGSLHDGAERARAEFDLAMVSVLLDAGAGAAWSFHDAGTG